MSHGGVVEEGGLAGIAGVFDDEVLGEGVLVDRA